MITITIEDFENLERIEKLCKESKEPIFVEENGVVKFVIMDLEYYDYLTNCEVKTENESENYVRNVSETQYLSSDEKVKESIIGGMKYNHNNCIKEKDVNW